MKHLRILSVLFALLCYLGVHNGFLALWDDSKSEPLHVFPYRADIFPQADQQALRHGIPIPSQEELSRLLEDYFS